LKKTTSTNSRKNVSGQRSFSQSVTDHGNQQWEKSHGLTLTVTWETLYTQLPQVVANQILIFLSKFSHSKHEKWLMHQPMTAWTGYTNGLLTGAKF
jgi:hypothetical protein